MVGRKALGHGGGVVGVGGHGAHAAGVQAGVVVVRPLVVHRGDHGLDHLAVGEAEDADLGPGEELLHHHMVARSAELLVQHDLLQAVLGLGLVLADEDALAQRQAVRLDDHRPFALRPDVVEGLGGVVKGLVGGGGDAVFLHQVLGKDLGRLDPGGRLVGAEGGDAHRRQRVHHAEGQGVVLGDHDVVEGLLFGKGDHRLHVGGLDVLANGVIADAAVAGGAPDLGAGRALFQGADDGVLTAAAANYQNFHSDPPLCRISDGTAAARRRPWRCRTCCRCR